MRPLYKTRLLVASILCIAAAATAQQTQGTAAVTAVPRLVRFAGSFHPPVNQPAGPLGATFAIYNQQEGGTPLWTEDQNVELDANGNYTALLGSAHNEGVPVELFTAGEARWLQVKFYVPAEVDLPRVLLVSVPYAMKAGDADTLGGKPASAYQLAGSALSVQPVESAKPAAAAVGRDSASRSAVIYQRRIAQLHRQIHRHNRRRGQLRDLPKQHQHRH
jgi:trimeric autotransporter adhesin